ncbi:hypothetical protein [Nocardioides sp. TF02-7]|uniref:hypothetical protein n=1 Tax=Nocardioides sp. TF02-7 TaxID=2917724 RepID=UPI001F070001|nr:hypothetical protein [Nocardioides sp. TF02-7]UMG94999.1 hypothetical protein MF408_03780 [Nocardioides sp. TF02-7]
MDHFLGEWRAWHDARERRLTAPDGYLAITGLYWLDERWQRFDDAPGEWRAAGDGAEVALGPAEWLEVGDEKLTGRHVFAGLDRRPVRALAGDATPGGRGAGRPADAPAAAPGERAAAAARADADLPAVTAVAGAGAVPSVRRAAAGEHRDGGRLAGGLGRRGR